jgi:hypothetical protein
MMSPRRDKERWTIRTVFIKYGRDQRMLIADQAKELFGVK